MKSKPTAELKATLSAKPNHGSSYCISLKHHNWFKSNTAISIMQYKQSVRVKNILLIVVWLSCYRALDAQTNVLTYHNDNARTGQNTSETALTPANVASSQFGKLYSVTVDGYVVAQPLVLTNVTLPGTGVHNVAYVATENDSLYAIDANNASVLWQLTFINPLNGVTTIRTSDLPACPDVGTQVGITGTPVIDSTTGTIYLVVSTKENGTYVQRLHAIDVASHSEKFGGPIVIQGAVAGTGTGSQNGTLNFDPLRDSQRPGLLLQNGQLIIGWGTHCDDPPYHGWIMSYSASTLAQQAVLGITPNSYGGGIWMSGGGVAGDSSFIYFVTGNGYYDGNSEFSDSMLKLGGSGNNLFAMTDWFTPYNQAYMGSTDRDLASGGVLLLPNLPSGMPHQQLAVLISKLGTLYVVDPITWDIIARHVRVPIRRSFKRFRMQQLGRGDHQLIGTGIYMLGVSRTT